MPAENTGRLLRLKFVGDGFKDGKVPLTIVASKLEALQHVLFHAAATVTKDKLARRGQWFNRHRSVVELIFSQSHHSDLVIEAELPSPGALLADQFDTGLQALDMVFQVSDAVAHNSVQFLDTNLPDRQDRTFFLRALENLCPSTTDEYQVELENCSRTHQKLTFTGQARETLQRYIANTTAPLDISREEARIVGVLTKIHVEVGPPLIAVQPSPNAAEIECYYDATMRDQIANLLAGSLVEVTGWATMTNEGRVKEMNSVLNVETVSMEPLRLSRIGNIRLREPIVFGIEYADGMWIYSNAPLNLWGCGIRREDAVRELSENFEYLWREFALEDDHKLDAKALLIKQRLLALVPPESPGVSHAA